MKYGRSAPTLLGGTHRWRAETIGDDQLNNQALNMLDAMRLLICTQPNLNGSEVEHTKSGTFQAGQGAHKGETIGLPTR